MKQPKRTSSLQRNLVIPAVAIMLMLSLGLVGVGYWAGNSIVDRMSEGLIRHLMASIRDHVTSIMDVPPKMLVRVRNDVSRHHIPLNDPRALSRELYALLQEEPGIDWLYFGNPSGGVVSVGRLQGGAMVIMMTDSFRAGTSREYYASTNGDIGTLRKSGGFLDARRKSWYQTAKQTGKSLWTKPYIGTVEPILGISMSAPAFDEGGNFVGVYGLDLILTSLSEYMKRQYLGRTGRAFLVDEDGDLIASSDGVLPVRIDKKGRQQRLNPKDARDPVVRAVARYLDRHPEIVARSRKQSTQYFVFNDAELGRVCGAVDSFTPNGKSWLIISALPASEFLGILRQAGYLSLGFMALLLVGSLTAGFWAVQRALQPLERLTASAHAIAEGSWPDVPETLRDDEIGVLARALDNMSRSLRNVHAELEGKVAERTAELSDSVEKLKGEIEERIRISQALEAETAARLTMQEDLHEKELLLLQQSRLAAMGEMIGNIAHQWRQPLNMLGLLVQELPVNYRKGTFDEQYLNANVAKMLATIRHMSRTIDDFRNFSRPEREKVPFRLLTVVEKTVGLLEGGLKAHAITTSITAESDLVVEGYPNQFSQALLNILLNARDALVERGAPAPNIAIDLRQEGERCVLTIADNAGGIPEEIMDRIFDPYFTTKGPDKGTGIGLYMAKVIIEKRMRGRISASNTAEGACFRIEL